MKPIKIFTLDLTPVTELTNYVSFMFTRAWHDVGEFQLVVNDEFARELRKDMIVALNKNKVGIIKHCEVQFDESGKISENWTFKGWTLKGELQKRLSIPPSHTSHDNKSGNAETVMKHYVNNHFVNPVDPNRKMPNLEIAPNLNRGEQINWQSRFKVIAEELAEISLATGLGWDVILDTENKKFVFEVFEGKNRSVNQRENSPVFFSPEFGNVKAQSFLDSDLEVRNVGYVGGQGEGVEREVVVIGNDISGYERFETFIDARDIDEEDPDSETLEQRGQRKMAEMQNELFFEAEIVTPIRKDVYSHEFQTFVHHTQPVFKRKRQTEWVDTFTYEKDYDLGDIVTIMNRKWGVIVDRRITKITEIYEQDGFKLEAVFGQERPTLISKLKDKFSQYDNELLR